MMSHGSDVIISGMLQRDALVLGQNSHDVTTQHPRHDDVTSTQCHYIGTSCEVPPLSTLCRHNEETWKHYKNTIGSQLLTLFLYDIG